MSGYLTLERQRDQALVDAVRAVLGLGPLYRGNVIVRQIQSPPDPWCQIETPTVAPPEGGGFYVQQRVRDPGVRERQRAAMRHRKAFDGL